MKIIDTHAHYDDIKFDTDRDELLAKGIAIKDTREGVKWELA